MSEASSLASDPVHPRPPDPSPPQRKGSDLPARLGTAAVLVPLVLWGIYAGGLWVLGMVMLLTVIAQREFYGLIEDKGAQPIVGFGLAAGAALPVVAYLGNEYHANLVMTASLLTPGRHVLQGLEGQRNGSRVMREIII